MKSSSSKYFSQLDHLRLLAALMVLLWHVLRYFKQVPTAEVPIFWPLSFAQEGHTGVALFMVLSALKEFSLKFIFGPYFSDRLLSLMSDLEWFGLSTHKSFRERTAF